MSDGIFQYILTETQSTRIVKAGGYDSHLPLLFIYHRRSQFTDFFSYSRRLVTHEIRIQGAQGYCWDFPIALAAAKEIPLRMLITHRFPLKELQKALNTALDQTSNSIKILLTP